MAALLRQKKISAIELCELCLERIKKTKELNQFITVRPGLSQRLAKSAEERSLNDAGRVGSLNGFPIAVKDNFCTDMMQTTCGSKMLHGYRPPYTATAVQRLLNEGAVIMGKTNLDEFAMGCGTTDSFYGPTRNPWRYRFRQQDAVSKMQSHAEWESSGENESVDSEDYYATPIRQQTVKPSDTDWYIAGGSSGGSAVAVATGAVFGALGSDTGGSTRNPASLCGVVGLKPTYGSVSRHGLIPLVNSMDVPGILTRTVGDAALLLNAVVGRDLMDSTTVNHQHRPVTLANEASVKGLHIGIPKEYHAPGLSSETTDAWGRIADMFSDSGARVSQVSLPHTQLSIVCYHILNSCEVASNMARFDGIEYGHRASDESSTEALYAQTRHEALNDVVRSRILAGNYFLLKENYDKYFMQALRIRRLIAQDFSSVFNSGVDLLLTPTVLSDAPHYQWFSQADNRTRTQEQDVFTQPVNMAGIPAVTVPTTLSSRGLPIGLQLIGQMFQEPQLLSAALWMEQEVNFPELDLSELDTGSTN